MKPHIMLVDDDKDELTFFLDALRQVPTNDGFKCTYAGSASQAIEMLKYLAPDFIFVDFNMPGMNGLKFLSLIRDKIGSERPEIYLYAIHNDEMVSRAAMNLGISGVIRKKYSIRELADQLAAIVSSPLAPAYIFSGGE